MKKSTTAKLRQGLATGLLVVCAAGNLLQPAMAKAKTKIARPPAPVASAPLRIELVVRTVNNFVLRKDVATFFERAKRANVSVVHVNVKQDEDDERPSGRVYYASAIAPVAAGYEKFDALAAAIAEAHQRNIKVYAWLPQFHDQEAMRAHPQWQMTSTVFGTNQPYQGQSSVEYFINPIDPEVQAYQLSLIQEVVRNYAVDGISLDWLRFDDLNMDTGAYTRQLAQQEIGLDPAELNFLQPSNALDRWNAWRAQKIGAYTQQVHQAIKAIRPQVRLSAFVLPPEFTEVGQDLALFGPALDEVLPMGYFRDWDFSAHWVSTRLMRDVARKKSTATVIKPTLDGTGSLAQNVGIVSAIQKNYPEVTAIAWFTAGYWQPRAIERIVQIHKAAAASR